MMYNPEFDSFRIKKRRLTMIVFVAVIVKLVFSIIY